MFEDKTILITGGTGSFGNVFVPSMLEKFDFKKIHWVSSSISPAYGAGLIAANYNDINVSIKQVISKYKS